MFLNQLKGISDVKSQMPNFEISNFSVQLPTLHTQFQREMSKICDTASSLKFEIGNLKFLQLAILGILCSCNSKPTPSVLGHAVSPFDTTHFETQALTPEDRAKLANAQGKTVHPIEIDALASKINSATGKLHLFCFWNLESDNSVSTLKAVNSLSAKFDSTKLDIIFVNMPGRQTMEAINLFIRENQLSDETLILEKADVSFFSKRIKKEFTGVTGLPVLILANKAEQVLQFINRPMDEKELLAIVQPLL